MVSVVFSLTNIANFVRMVAISTRASLSSILLRSILYFQNLLPFPKSIHFHFKNKKLQFFFTLRAWTSKIPEPYLVGRNHNANPDRLKIHADSAEEPFAPKEHRPEQSASKFFVFIYFSFLFTFLSTVAFQETFHFSVPQQTLNFLFQSPKAQKPKNTNFAFFTTEP